ncbi:MAG: aminoglycoside phosphotransferase family protein [Acidimicrobiales bacterium]|nr:aminoglycoside phosphotransferase family protein [Acidimicrobiales bacterium]
MNLPIADLEALDADALTALLRASGDPELTDVTVRSVRTEPVGASTGFLGRLRRLHLSYDPAGPSGPDRLVAKAPTTDPGGLQVGRMLNVWARESRFFAEIAPICPARVPRCYANLAEPDEDRWLLLLADAGDSVAPSQTDGATEAQAAATLSEIARLHRELEGRRPAAWLPGFDAGPFTALQQAVQQAVDPFLRRYGHLLPEGGADLLRRFAPLLASWAAQRRADPLTLVHADYRLDNLIIDAEQRVTILDWQTALIGNGAMDVASLLVTSLTVEHRRAWEDELLIHYAAAAGHTVEHVRHSVRQHLLWWMALYANNLSRIDPADRAGVAMFEHTVRRTFVAALDHEVGALLG